MSICPHCTKQIPFGATKCPHCTGDIKYQPLLGNGHERIGWELAKYFLLAGVIAGPVMYYIFWVSHDFYGYLIAIAIGAFFGYSLPYIPIAAKKE